MAEKETKQPARVYEKQVQCPVCGESFAARVMRHYLFRKVHEDTDFCPYYKGSNPLLESVWVCPHCHYTAAQKDFFQLTQDEKDAIARYSLAVLAGLDVPHRVRGLEDALLQLQLACQCYERRPTMGAQQAAHYLKSAWLYRYGRDEKKEKEFLRLAVTKYREVFEKSHDFAKGLGEIGTAYLIGDLYLRLGDLENARKWLAHALFNYPELDKDHRFKEMARRRMEDVADILDERRRAETPAAEEGA